MSALRLSSLTFFAWSMGAACSSSSPPAPSPPSDAGDIDASGATDGQGEPDACSAPKRGDFPCDVAAVIAICQNCHQRPPIRSAPFPFMTYEDTQEVYFGTELRAQRMKEVIEPDSPIQMPPPTATDVPQLTDAQRNTLRAWFRACTPPEPEGQGCDKGETE